MKKGNRAKSIMVDCEDINPRAPKRTTLIRAIKGVRK